MGISAHDKDGIITPKDITFNLLDPTVFAIDIQIACSRPRGVAVHKRLRRIQPTVEVRAPELSEVSTTR